MLQANELVTMIIGICVLAFYIINRRGLLKVQQGSLFLFTLALAVGGWIVTVLEGYFWQDALNILEHTLLAASSLVLAVASWRIYIRKGGLAE